MKKILFLLTVSVLTFSSCKYEEGPAISIHSKKSRLAGEWTLESVTLNGTDITSTIVAAYGSDYTFHIEKDGTYHQHIQGVEYPGKWTLEEGKKELHMLDDAAGSVEEHFEILKLKTKEMWLKHDHSTTTPEVYEYHYKQ